MGLSNTPSSAENGGNGEPSEFVLRRLAFQMRSCNFGCGGRFVTPPTPDKMASVTDAELDLARTYFSERLRGVVSGHHVAPTPRTTSASTAFAR